jgi:hypothetical protein
VAHHPPSIGYLRVAERGSRQIVVTAACCPLSQPADESCIGHFSCHLGKGWLRLGLAPDILFQRGVPHVPTEKFRDYAVIFAAWPWLEAGVINHKNPCGLALTSASETACL